MKNKILLIIGIVLIMILIDDFTFSPKISIPKLEESINSRYYEIIVQAILTFVIISGVGFAIHSEKNE